MNRATPPQRQHDPRGHDRRQEEPLSAHTFPLDRDRTPQRAMTDDNLWPAAGCVKAVTDQIERRPLFDLLYPL